MSLIPALALIAAALLVVVGALVGGAVVYVVMQGRIVRESIEIRQRIDLVMLRIDTAYSRLIEEMGPLNEYAAARGGATVEIFDAAKRLEHFKQVFQSDAAAISDAAERWAAGAEPAQR